MAYDPSQDEGPLSRPVGHEIGQDLSSLSLFELEERVTALKREIKRIEETVEQKQRTQAAADAFFKT